MPAETHQRGRRADAESVIDLLRMLLDDDAAGEDVTLSALGVHPEDLVALCDAVREELAERTVGPEFGPDALDPSMTLVAAARVMASLLQQACGGGHSR